mgnify:CR=1 FL=1
MKPDPWKCRACDTHYPVPSLARACEHEHHRLRDTNPDHIDTDDDQETR